MYEYRFRFQVVEAGLESERSMHICKSIPSTNEDMHRLLYYFHTLNPALPWGETGELANDKVTNYPVTSCSGLGMQPLVV
jgi:hypothetical protein